MRMRQLILQDREQVCDDVQSFRQERHALIHLEIASDSLVDGVELRFSPHQFRRIQD